MSVIIFAVSFSMLFLSTDSYYLKASSNYLKPKLQRNNVVNKKVWVRNKFQDSGSFEKTHLGNFIFRPDSMDMGVQQNALDVFGENNILDTPYVTDGQRARRSPELIHKHRPRKSMKARKHTRTKIEDSAMLTSQLASDLKPGPMINEHPYDVDTLLQNDEINNETIEIRSNNILNKNVTKMDDKHNNNDKTLHNMEQSPKRSKKDHDNMSNMKYNVLHGYNSTDDNNNLINRGVNEKDKPIWDQNNQPISDSNIYKVVTEEPNKKPCTGVTERGLIKVISMLTKSFKKIMKQHNDIKNIHDKLIQKTQEFDQKASGLSKKVEDFRTKYTDTVQISKKIKEAEMKMNSTRDYLKIKYKNFEDNVAEFQNQQKKFMSQQKEFFEVQKMMLAKNEQINAKQDQIAKRQSEISYQLNNFVRILKKAKQIVNDRTFSNKIAHGDNVQDIKQKSKVHNVDTSTASTTQSMKINLFSIPTKNKLNIKDELIIKEKDDKHIDDLIYKYYFNNTFIDSLMKTKILKNFASHIHNADIEIDAKNKRDEIETTIMLPIANNVTKLRAKRWINTFGKKLKRVSNHSVKATESANILQDPSANKVEVMDTLKSDPYIAMATAFCNEIGRNENDQSLKWCVEKSLRRLRLMESMTNAPFTKTLMSEKIQQTKIQTDTKKKNNDGSESVGPSTHTVSEDIAAVTDLNIVTPLSPFSSIQNAYFPDNDELESNLKQYELTPDTEGNVYFDGSLHISDFGRMNPIQNDSEGTSDVMPGLVDSDSKVEIDPMAFEIQAKRRANVRRINEEMLRQMRHG